MLVGRCRGSHQTGSAEGSGAPQHRICMRLAKPLHQQAAADDEIGAELCEEVPPASLENRNL